MKAISDVEIESSRRTYAKLSFHYQKLYFYFFAEILEILDMTCSKPTSKDVFILF